MKSPCVLRAIALACASTFAAGAIAQAADSVREAQLPPTRRPSYSIPAYEENWSFLRDPSKRSDPWDPIKYVPLGKKPFTYASFGIDLREKYERYGNYSFDPRNGSDGWLLSRYLVHTDLHVQRMRLYAELEQSSVSGRSGTPDPLFGTSTNLSSLFGEYQIGGVTGAAYPPLTLRYGRQTLNYGKGRIIDPREGLNVRQFFDGAFARVNSANWQTDAFLMSPVSVPEGGFQATTDRQSHLWGVYATHTSRSVLDLYYVGQQLAHAVYLRGSGPEVRHTIGVRSAGAVRRFDGDIEGDWQFGSFRGGAIDAWSLAGSTGYTMPVRNGIIRLGIDAGVATGDHNPYSPRLTAFRPAYPSGLTFGIVRANGPENVSGFALTQLYSYKQRLTLVAKEFVYTRQSLNDGIYVPGGFPLRPAGGSDEPAIGDAGFVSASFAVNRHLVLNSAYARYLTGAYLQQVGPAPNVPSASIAYFTFWTEYKI